MGHSEQRAIIKVYFSSIHSIQHSTCINSIQHSTCTNSIQGSIFIAILCLKFKFFLETFSFDLIEVSICKYSLIFILDIYPKFPIHIPFHSYTFPIYLFITLGIFLKHKEIKLGQLFSPAHELRTLEWL